MLQISGSAINLARQLEAKDYLNLQMLMSNGWNYGEVVVAINYHHRASENLTAEEVINSALTKLNQSY